MSGHDGGQIILESVQFRAQLRALGQALGLRKLHFGRALRSAQYAVRRPELCRPFRESHDFRFVTTASYYEEGERVPALVIVFRVFANNSVEFVGVLNLEMRM